MRNFKRTLVAYASIAALFFVGISNTNAQDGNNNVQDNETFRKGEVGLRFMPTFTALDVSTSSGGTVKGEATLGYGAGVMIGFNFTEHVGIQSEIIYSTLAQKSKDANVEREIRLQYINIPLLLSLNTGKDKMVNLNGVVGPQIGFNVGSSFETLGVTNENDPEPVLSVKKSDIGFAFGGGVDFGLNPDRTLRLGLGYRGVIGLVDIGDRNHNTTTNNYYLLERSHVNTNAAYLGVSLLF